MHLPSVSSLSALVLALCLLVAHSPVFALSIPPSIKSPPRVKSVRSADQWTNAQRLAAGLPPRAPRTFKRATSTSGNVFVPAPVKRSAPSPSPSPFALSKGKPVPTSYAGHIVARHLGSNDAVGYLRVSSSGVSLGGDKDSAHVTFTTSGSNTLFSINNVVSGTTSDAETTASTQETAFIGATGTSALGGGSAKYVHQKSGCARFSLFGTWISDTHLPPSPHYSTVALGNVKQTAPHARPAVTGGESTIWTFDASSQALTAHWVNPDGSHPKTRVAYSAHDGSLVLTGDVDAYNKAHPDDPVTEVALYFVSE
ncbi:hypothetical protein BD414DRAFT_155933 [Trametes punicea]|nr:hypothetical protein BD414DRAFT_155933 [Trametes punicea]